MFVQTTYLFLIALYVLPNARSLHGITAGLVSAGIVTVSILLHELGHALAFRHYGEPEATIVLWGLGGLTYGRSPNDPWQSIWISLAGPALGMGFGGVALALRVFLGPMLGPQATDILDQLVYVNVFWTLFNVLPLHPMDGGNALRTYLVSKLGDRGLRASLIVSMLTGAALVALAFWARMIFLGILVAMMLMRNFAELRGTKDPLPPPGSDVGHLP